MTPREGAEAAWKHWRKLCVKRAIPNDTESFYEAVEAAITDHVRALLADDEATIEAMLTAFCTGMLPAHEAMRAALAALRRKAGV
jgi:Tfp pilus assembly pilus retraction ATPase PilT